MHLKGHFISTQSGRLFVCQTGKPLNETGILCLPPVMEEMNLSRAVIAKQCQHLAAHHYPCFTLDYFGCGDSEGEFEQADSNIWMDNIISAVQWLKEQGINKVVIFAYRCSALVLSSVQDRLRKTNNIIGQIFFKPILQGKAFINQLTRLSAVSSALSKGATLDSHEVGGYRMKTAFRDSIASLSIIPQELLFPTIVNELASQRVSPAIASLVEKNSFVSVQLLDCPAFWQVPEIFELDDLNQQSLLMMREFV
jgi:exosortase A-associated hydrolase 2